MSIKESNLLLIAGLFISVGVILLFSQTSVDAAPVSENCFAFDSDTGTITSYYDYENNDSNNPACNRDVDIPGTIDGVAVTTIGDGAFSSNNLTSVTIPSSVTGIGGNAFRNNNLTNLILGNSVTTIGNLAFYANSLTSVTIPESVTTLGNEAFATNNLTSVTLPNSITTIGEFTFATNNLTSVTIPNSVTGIHPVAFIGNSSFGRDAETMINSGDPEQIQAYIDATRLVKLYTVDPSNPNGLQDSIVSEADLGIDFNQNGNLDEILGGHLINPPDEEEEDPPLTTQVPNNTTSYFVLPEGVSNPVFTTTPDNQIIPDPAFSYPAGLVSFQFDTEEGATETVTLYFDLPGQPSTYLARKYNPTTKAFTTIDQATITRETYNNKDLLKLTYPITDGGLLDQDNTTNGTIVDPVGLAQQTTDSPNTGLPTHWLLGVK